MTHAHRPETRMTLSIHHVPGRLRVRRRGLVRSAGGADRLRARLSALLSEEPGVRRAEVNAPADSVTVLYDPARVAPTDLLQRIAGMDGIARPAETGSARWAGSILPPHTAASALTFGAMFGKALFDAVLHKSVERSIRSVFGGPR